MLTVRQGGHDEEGPRHKLGQACCNISGVDSLQQVRRTCMLAWSESEAKQTLNRGHECVHRIAHVTL